MCNIVTWLNYENKNCINSDFHIFQLWAHELLGPYIKSLTASVCSSPVCFQPEWQLVICHLWSASFHRFLMVGMGDEPRRSQAEADLAADQMNLAHVSVCLVISCQYPYSVVWILIVALSQKYELWLHLHWMWSVCVVFNYTGAQWMLYSW